MIIGIMFVERGEYIKMEKEYSKGYNIYNNLLEISVSEYGYFDIVGYVSNDIPEVLILPSEINGLKAKCIKKNSFFCCDLLKTVIVSEGYEEIEYEAFAYSSLEKLELPSTLENIDCFCTRGCMSLEKIIVNPNNEKYESRYSCNAVNVSVLDHMIIGCKNTIIPQGIRSIEYSVFVVGFSARFEYDLYIPGTVNHIYSIDSNLIPNRCLFGLRNLFLEKPLPDIIGTKGLISHIASIELTLWFPRKYSGLRAKCDDKRYKFRYYDYLPIQLDLDKDGVIIPKINESGENKYSSKDGIFRVYKRVYDIKEDVWKNVTGIGDFAFTDCKVNKIIIPKELRDNISPLAFVNYKGEIEYE